MRFTFTDLQNAFLQDTGNAGRPSATLLSWFQMKLAARYQQAFSEITNQTTQLTKTAFTVINQQYYHIPPGVVDIETETVAINGIPYPIITVDSQLQWDRINQ